MTERFIKPAPLLPPFKETMLKESQDIMNRKPIRQMNAVEIFTKSINEHPKTDAKSKFYQFFNL